MIAVLSRGRIFAALLAGGVLSSACGGERGATGRAESSNSSGGEEGQPAPSESRAAPPAAAKRPALRDPVQLTAAAAVNGRHVRFSGLGECQHTENASIYEVPAAMWSVRFSDDVNKFRYLSLTLWRPRGASAMQVALGLAAEGETAEIATVEGAETKGSGAAHVAPAGSGGTIVVEGKDAHGHAVMLTVDCSRYTEPVAEGG